MIVIVWVSPTTVDDGYPATWSERQSCVFKRTETLSPLQALALFNNGFMLTMAKHLAERAGSVEAAFRLALARDPAADERQALEAYAKQHGLANACRVILNLNEFVFVD